MINSGENLTEERFAKSRQRKNRVARMMIPFPHDTNFVPAGGNLMPFQIGS